MSDGALGGSQERRDALLLSSITELEISSDRLCQLSAGLPVLMAKKSKDCVNHYN